MLVIDNTNANSSLEDTLFWYKADPNIEPYRMGKEIYWQLSSRYAKTDVQRAMEEEQQRNAQAETSRSKEPLMIQVTDERGNVLANTNAGANGRRRVDM